MSRAASPEPGPPTEERVDLVLDALADSTRRRILESVAAHGPLTATALAQEFPVTRQAVSKHLERLAVAGLVESRRSGRETLWSAIPAPLGDARDWLDRVASAWDRRLGALADRAARRGSEPRDAVSGRDHGPVGE